MPWSPSYVKCHADVVCTLVQVRPTPLEASMLQAAWGSNPLHHLLQSYQVSLVLFTLQPSAYHHANLRTRVQSLSHAAYAGHSGLVGQGAPCISWLIIKAVPA